MLNKNSKKIEKREDKISRFCIFVSNMGVNEEAKPTHIHEAIGTHVNTIRDMIDNYETIKESPDIEVVRDKNGKVIRIVRIKDQNEDLLFKKEIRDSITNMQNKLDELITILNNAKMGKKS